MNHRKSAMHREKLLTPTVDYLFINSINVALAIGVELAGDSSQKPADQVRLMAA